MIYKCDKCNYFSKRRGDLIRHQNRQFPCNKEIEVIPDKIEVDTDYAIDEKNQPNQHAKQSVNSSNQQENPAIAQNQQSNDQANQPNQQDDDLIKQIKEYKCKMCFKCFTRNQNLKNHEAKCDGLDPLQCQVCMKLFKSKNGKLQHKYYVKCKPHASSRIFNNNNNNNMNIDNSTNIDNSINIDNSTKNIVYNNFNMESMKELVMSEDFMTEFAKYIKEDGKSAVVKGMNYLYFNDRFPENQTLKKDRKDDGLVKIRVTNGWEPKIETDLNKPIIKKMEVLYDLFFKRLTEENLLTKAIRENIRVFGNQMMWFNGFMANYIRYDMSISLNEPFDDDEEKRRNKGLSKVIWRNVLERTKLLEEAEKLLKKAQLLKIE